jgi:hypothetical protein
MPENRDQLERLCKMASLMRRLSGEHTAADNPLIAAKLSGLVLERLAPR